VNGFLVWVGLCPTADAGLIGTKSLFLDKAMAEPGIRMPAVGIAATVRAGFPADGEVLEAILHSGFRCGFLGTKDPTWGSCPG